MGKVLAILAFLFSSVGRADEFFFPRGAEEHLSTFSQTFESRDGEKIAANVLVSLKWEDGKVGIEYTIRATAPVAGAPTFLPNPYGTTRTNGTLIGRFYRVYDPATGNLLVDRGAAAVAGLGLGEAVNQHLRHGLKLRPTSISISMVESNKDYFEREKAKNPQATDADLLSRVPSLRGLFETNELKSAVATPNEFFVGGEIVLKPKAVAVRPINGIACAFRALKAPATPQVLALR